MLYIVIHACKFYIFSFFHFVPTERGAAFVSLFAEPPYDGQSADFEDEFAVIGFVRYNP